MKIVNNDRFMDIEELFNKEALTKNVESVLHVTLSGFQVWWNEVCLCTE